MCSILQGSPSTERWHVPSKEAHYQILTYHWAYCFAFLLPDAFVVCKHEFWALSYHQKPNFSGWYRNHGHWTKPGPFFCCTYGHLGVILLSWENSLLWGHWQYILWVLQPKLAFFHLIARFQQFLKGSHWRTGPWLSTNRVCAYVICFIRNIASRMSWRHQSKNVVQFFRKWIQNGVELTAGWWFENFFIQNINIFVYSK